MKILITGACGFVGSVLARSLKEHDESVSLFGVDNFSRPGSEGNQTELGKLGVKLIHADLRSQSDVDALPEVDWILDCAANPSVLAGADGKTSSRQLMEHNLLGTINMLEFCRRTKAGFTLMSTSRVYSIEPLAALPVIVQDRAFAPDLSQVQIPALSSEGVSESFSTAAPVSLYGASKVASESLALEYGSTFDFPVWINRCGVLAGAGQFGRPDQGIFSFWINAHLRRKPMRYIGFDGMGHQTRDCLHPQDLTPLILQQISEPLKSSKPRLCNFSGGLDSACSLRQLTDWCDARFGSHAVGSDSNPRPFDLPWVVLDSTLARQTWSCEPKTKLQEILQEISLHAEANPEWLALSNSR